MSRQDKATTERHTRTLREFVKRPENKYCADCKRNDPRWASWNLGVYLCIRCSGIHRGMGTHISKVKSIDLDTWTPEQMQSIEKWGNRRANLYWEAHLKPGHVPPEHKMDSFIRSKYETRRWALDGPLPSDPAILEDSSATVPAPVSEPLSGAPQPPQSQGHSRTSSSFTRTTPTPPVNRQPQHHQLLSTTVAGRTAPTVAPLIPGPGQAQQAQTPQKVPEPENDLFSLDFHAASANSGLVQQLQPKKDMKDDILSLFSTPAQGNAAAENSNGWGHFQSSPPSSAMAPSAPWGAPNAQHQASTIGTGGHGAWGPSSPAQASSVGGSSSSQHMQLKPTNMMGPNGSGLWNAPPAQQVQQPQVTSMIGANGAGAWGTSSGWTAPAPPAQGNLWGTTATTAPVQQQPDLFGSNVWGSSSDGGGLGNGGMSGGSGMWGASTGGGGAGEVRQKKDDVFGDLWGGFK